MTINSSAKSLFQQPLLFHYPPPKLATRKHIRKIVRSNFPLRSCNPVRYKIHEWSRLRILEDDSSCENEHRYVARFPVLIKWEMEIWLFLGRWDRSIEPRTLFPIAENVVQLTKGSTSMSLPKHRFFIIELPIKLNDQDINKAKCTISNFFWTSVKYCILWIFYPVYWRKFPFVSYEIWCGAEIIIFQSGRIRESKEERLRLIF